MPASRDVDRDKEPDRLEELRLPWRAEPEGNNGNGTDEDDPSPWWRVLDAEDTVVADLLTEDHARLIADAVNAHARNHGKA